jgi:hypothetical protein
MVRNFGIHPHFSPEARSLASDLGEGLAILVGGLMIAGIGLFIGFAIAWGG